MNSKVLKLFGKSLKTNEVKLDFGQVNKVAVKLGYIIPAYLCTPSVLKWLHSKKMDVTKTFYSNWNDIISKNRFELFIDQLMHYSSTYGTDFSAEAYVPNDGNNTPELTSMKVLEEISIDEVTTKVLSMLYSGIALKQDTTEDLLQIIQKLNIKYDIEKVRNREAKMVLCYLDDKLPATAEEFVRYLVYLYTGKTLVIKNPKLIQEIKSKDIEIAPYIVTFGIEKLAEVFYRYKALFLAMRNTTENKSIINRLRRLAEVYHKPYKPGFFEQILSNPDSLDMVDAMLPKLNNFKKVTLLQAIKVRMKKPQSRAFVIRNQKLYLKTGRAANSSNSMMEYYSKLYDKIYNSLIASLSNKATTITLPENIKLTAPTSEKSFIQNIPLGSYVDLGDKDCILGVYWHEKDGARDIDLSCEDIHRNRIGWNSYFYSTNKAVVYSGDMTSAPNGATELLYARSGFDSMIVKVNLFSESPHMKDNQFKFKMMLAIDQIQPTKNYMIDPNKIIFSCELVGSTEQRETSLGLVVDDKYIFANFGTGTGRVSRNNSTDYIQYVKDTIDCYVELKPLLEAAGFTIVDKDAEIDLTNIDKSSLIELLG